MMCFSNDIIVGYGELKLFTKINNIMNLKIKNLVIVFIALGMTYCISSKKYTSMKEGLERARCNKSTVKGMQWKPR